MSAYKPPVHRRELREFYIFLNVVTRWICQEALAACMGKMIHSRGVPDGHNRKNIGKYPGDSEGTAGELGTFIRPHDFTLMMQYLIKILDSNLHKAGFKAFKCKAASIVDHNCAVQICRRLYKFSTCNVHQTLP